MKLRRVHRERAKLPTCFEIAFTLEVSEPGITVGQAQAFVAEAVRHYAGVCLGRVYKDTRFKETKDFK